ncbi:MAG: GTP 3',8-cyclase MoaA [Phycisphaeraceae bacterium]|nr:GTP 3',8-cyclase MoaA [Phycisphaeraceae bacterium]
MSLALPILARSAGAVPPAAPASDGRSLRDSHGRVIRDLRLSITDRCNFRCVYCMDPDVRFADPSELLSVEQLIRLASVCVGLGIEKVRITGGEPTVHPRLTDIIRGVSALPIDDVALTTNGSLIDEARAAEWHTAGLRRITLSIDSLRPDRFAALTRSNCPPSRVLDAIDASRRAGLGPVKLNAVVVRGFNEDEVQDLARLAHDLGVEMRFIEFMPLDSGHHWDRARVVPAEEIVRRIDAVLPLVPDGRDDPSSTSLNYRFADGSPGRIGLIAPVTRPFCGACSRLRITADGKIRPCLFSRQEWDLRPLLWANAGDDQLKGFIADAVWTKQAGHGISSRDFVQPARPMSAIGG